MRFLICKLSVSVSVVILLSISTTEAQRTHREEVQPEIFWAKPIEITDLWRTGGAVPGPLGKLSGKFSMAQRR
jgi:hypothetical protein